MIYIYVTLNEVKQRIAVNNLVTVHPMLQSSREFRVGK